ncbi:MAG: hypothetical protein ACTSXO_04205 [Candidatus Heimdallarchaeota archaeon]|nr:MAG: hypothetical protein DRP02_02530 [Candidatus Gerdarchaeota archaeon]
MTMTIASLAKKGYKGCSVRRLLNEPELRKQINEDPAVRGNVHSKGIVMDKIAVSGKVLLIGPTGEAKTLFARTILKHLTNAINERKYHIAGCPFNEDAGYLIHIAENYAKDPAASAEVLKNLCPFCKQNIAESIKKVTNQDINLDRSNDILALETEQVIKALNAVKADKTVVNVAQIDPRNDPEGLYMLLAGVENLEQLFGGKTSTTFSPMAHKVGVLSQGFVVVNEIQRLPLNFLEALMGFLEDPSGIKYSIQGRPVFVDGAMIFTSNAPLSVFGEEAQPIINRIPEVLWPARTKLERIKIVEDMFKEHLTLCLNDMTANPALVSLLEKTKQFGKKGVSKLAIQFIGLMADLSIPNALKSGETEAYARKKVTRDMFFKSLIEIHDPEKTPHVDLRTLYSLIGETVLRKDEFYKQNSVAMLTLDDAKRIVELFDIPRNLINDAMQEVKTMLRRTIKTDEELTTVQSISEDIDKMKALTDEELSKIIIAYEGLEKQPKKIQEAVISQLKPSYEQLLLVDHI